MKTREDKTMVKLDIFFKFVFFWHIIRKSAHSLFDAWSFLLIYIWIAPNEVAKHFVNWYSKKFGLGSWTINSDHGKSPSSMVRLHCPWCKPAISLQWKARPFHKWESPRNLLRAIAFCSTTALYARPLRWISSLATSMDRRIWFPARLCLQSTGQAAEPGLNLNE